MPAQGYCRECRRVYKKNWRHREFAFRAERSGVYEFMLALGISPTRVRKVREYIEEAAGPKRDGWE